MSKPTWEQLVGLEPKLADLERAVRRVKGRRGFCANYVWEERFKPRLCLLVGWDRPFPRYAGLEERPGCGRLAKPGEVVIVSLKELVEEMGDDYEERREAALARMGPLAVLWGSAAYDVVYERLYELLPDCNHPSNFGCM